MGSSKVQVLQVSANTADHYATIYSSLRKKGKPIPSNDMWIAAHVMEYGAGLLSRDQHFSQVEGLKQGYDLADFLP